MKRQWLTLPLLVALIACEPARQGTAGGSHPQSGTVHVSKDGRFVFTLSQDHDAVMVWDRETKQTIREIAVGDAPVAMALMSDGRLAVVNSQSDSVSIVDPNQDGPAVEHYAGLEPSAVIEKDGKLLIALAASEKLVEMDPSSGAITRELDLTDSMSVVRRPSGLLGLSGNKVYVSHFYGGEISVVDTASWSVKPERVKITMDNNGLLKANQLSSLTANPDESEVSAPHQENNDDPGGFRNGTTTVPSGYYVEGPSGMPAVVPAVGTVDPRTDIDTSFTDKASRITCSTCTGTAAPGTSANDTVEDAQPNEIRAAPHVFNVFVTKHYGQAKLNSPTAVAYVDGGRGKLVVFRGSQNVLLMRTKTVGDQDPVVEEYPVGQGANGIAVSPDGKNAYVWSAFDYKLHEIDVPMVEGPDDVNGPGLSVLGPNRDADKGRIRTSEQVPQRIAKEFVLPSNINVLPENVLKGRKIFFDATDEALTRKGAVSCASCHPNGQADNNTWMFGTQKKRNTPQLGGGISGTAPFHWDGDRPDTFSMNLTVQAFMGGGQGLNGPQISDLFAFIDTIPRAKSKVMDKVELQDSIARGEAIFFSQQTQCGTCHEHRNGLYTDNRAHDVKTSELEDGLPFFTPVLVGLSASGPYFHDGRVSTLEQLVDQYVATDKMGKGSHLTVEQRADLVNFLKSL